MVSRYHTCTKSILIVSSKLYKHKLKKAYLVVLMAQALRTLEGTLIKVLAFNKNTFKLKRDCNLWVN